MKSLVPGIALTKNSNLEVYFYCRTPVNDLYHILEFFLEVVVRYLSLMSPQHVV
jgi:hypothetical protein